MAKPPRRPRIITRSFDGTSPTAVSRELVARVDRRQPDLFFPGFIPPCKPTLRDRVPAGPLWQYEIKHDGYRMQAHANADAVRLFTKSGLDYAARLPRIAAAIASLGRNAILDGEAVMVGPDGVTDFFALHGALSARRAPEALLYAFDLLWLDGEDLRPLPLAERQAALAELLVASCGTGIELVEHLVDDGQAMFLAACGMGLEGIVAKRVDQPYRSGRAEGWVKVKNVITDHFAVIGFEPTGASGVASLSLATLTGDGRLGACGSVGSGLSEATSRALRVALEAGEPVVVDVEFRGWTPAGELRQPAFKGWHREE